MVEHPPCKRKVVSSILTGGSGAAIFTLRFPNVRLGNVKKFLLSMLLIQVFFSHSARAEGISQPLQNHFTIKINEGHYFWHLSEPRFTYAYSETPETCDAAKQINMIKLVSLGECRVLLYIPVAPNYEIPINQPDQTVELIFQITGRFAWPPSQAISSQDLDGFPVNLAVPNRNCTIEGAKSTLFGIKLSCRSQIENLIWLRDDGKRIPIRPTGTSCPKIGSKYQIADEIFKCIKSGKSLKWDSGSIGPIIVSTYSLNFFGGPKNFASTKDQPVDTRTGKKIDSHLLQFLDYLNEEVGYLTTHPEIPFNDYSAKLSNAWGYAEHFGFIPTASDTSIVDNMGKKATDPQYSHFYDIWDQKGKRWFCVIDQKFMGGRYIQSMSNALKTFPKLTQYNLLIGSCRKFYGLSKV